MQSWPQLRLQERSIAFKPQCRSFIPDTGEVARGRGFFNWALPEAEKLWNFRGFGFGKTSGKLFMFRKQQLRFPDPFFQETVGENELLHLK
jgi:hypothetical protein